MTIILGGGVGGLSAAYYLLKNGKHKITLLESTNNLGGWIKSVRDPKTGILFEKGPRTVRIKGTIGINTVSLIEELNLTSKVIPISADKPSLKNRLIYVNNNLHSLPSDFSALFKKIPPFKSRLITALIKDLVTSPKKTFDDSIYTFVERRFGQELADYLVSSMICGICAGDSKEISVKFLMPTLFELEQKHGSVVKGLFSNFISNKRTNQTESECNSELVKKAVTENWSVFGLEGGLSLLPLTLNDYIVSNGANIQMNTKVTNLSINSCEVKCISENKIIESNHIISSLPAKNLASLLRKDHPQLAHELDEIPYVTVGVVNLAFEGQVLKQEAFGFLVPPSQGLPILGIVFDSCNFPQNDYTILTVMLGGRWFSKYFGDNATEEQLLSVALAQCKEILGITEIPVAFHSSIMSDCIPQYVVGHYNRIDRVFSYINKNKLPLSLVGSAFNGISVNDIILSSKKIAQEINKKVLLN